MVDVRTAGIGAIALARHTPTTAPHAVTLCHASRAPRIAGAKVFKLLQRLAAETGHGANVAGAAFPGRAVGAAVIPYRVVGFKFVLVELGAAQAISTTERVYARMSTAVFMPVVP